MFTSVVALSLAAFAVAAPTTSLCTTTSTAPVATATPQIQEYSFTLKAEGYPTLSLNAMDSGIVGVKDLFFERLAAYPGTPAYLNETYLDFDLGESQPYAMEFAEVGNNYGYTVPVQAVFGQSNGREGFSINNYTLSAKLDAALESFFACSTKTSTGEDILGLFWGVYNSNGTAPYGCAAAQLIQNFNVPASS